MATCSNCKASFGCSCQIRIAANGTSCCSACVAAYNAKHPVAKPAIKAKENIITLENTTPSNVTIFYRGPGHQV